ncbi:RDD family protein [Lysobacter arvi]|uniref:RDD family protein n=1 Tax=Lysobacter arvi TaxID=3038776 RepID=A0ABU1CBI0_9GAMM|nr:RDD family protein [Lysobacter arvi]MDR0182485.1 RDD family protein [Lysobacter arvi]
MEQHNPYQRPQAQVADALPPDGLVPASRGKRLAAAILDTLIALAVLIPIMAFGGYFTALAQGAGLMTQLGWGLFGLAVFFAVQFVPLKATAQTWGKKAVGIRIVDMDGQQPGLPVLLGRRYLFANGIGLVPLVGGLLSIANVLFIFRSDRRCVHDLIADTRVVEAR